MFCPFCKAEYRAGIGRCSDCSFPLVDAIPRDESDPNFMVVLWNGESLQFLEAVCTELDSSQLPVAAPRVEVLLRDKADRYHLKSLKTFPYVLGVFKRDFEAARKILESAAAKTSSPILLPPAAAYPEPFDERPMTSRGGKSDVSLDATATIYSSENLRAVEFLEASLDVVNIPFRRVSLESGAYEIQVRPKDEGAARQVAEEIGNGVSSQAAAAAQEDALLQDQPPKNYFLMWFLAITYWFFLSGILSFGEYAASDKGAKVFGSLLIVAGAASVLGSVWMMCQAMRYEVRSFRYCVATQFPFAFVWYFVERVMARTGVQKLPISARIQKQPPQT